MTRSIHISWTIVLLVLLNSFHDSACRQDAGAVTPPDTVDSAGMYGHGTISMNAVNGGGDFAVNGAYKPSDQFADDSAGNGAGGFLHDTTLFGRSIQAMFAGENAGGRGMSKPP